MIHDDKVIQGLNGLLADASVFYQKLRHYHWNVEGRHFFELHVKFEELYTRWAATVDEIAERILTVGGRPLHTMRGLVDGASLHEDESIPTGVEMVERAAADLTAILERSGAVIESAEAAGDRGTVNLLDGLRDAIEKDLWMLHAWSQEAAQAWG